MCKNIIKIKNVKNKWIIYYKKYENKEGQLIHYIGQHTAFNGAGKLLGP